MAIKESEKQIGMSTGFSDGVRVIHDSNSHIIGYITVPEAVAKKMVEAYNKAMAEESGGQ